jgi:hypothetical protein
VTPNPADTAESACWAVVRLGDCGRYQTLSLHVDRAEAEVAAAAVPDAVILFKPGRAPEPAPMEEF